MRTTPILFLAAAALASLLIAPSCHETPGPNPPPQPGPGDAGPDAPAIVDASPAPSDAAADARDAAPDAGTLPPWDGSDVCGSVEARAAFLGCTLARADAGTWATVCRADRALGLPFFDVRCAAKATTRAALAQCMVTCR